jgi:5'-3' exonuclease
LSGCDYLQSLPGMGLKRAHALIKKFKSYDKVSVIFIALDNGIYLTR